MRIVASLGHIVRSKKLFKSGLWLSLHPLGGKNKITKHQYILYIINHNCVHVQTPPWNCVVTGSSVSFSKYTGPGRCRVSRLEKLWTKSSAAFVVKKTPRPKYVKPNCFFRTLTRAKCFNRKWGRDFVVPAGSQHTPADSGECRIKKKLKRIFWFPKIKLVYQGFGGVLRVVSAMLL